MDYIRHALKGKIRDFESSNKRFIGKYGLTIFLLLYKLKTDLVV